MAEARGSAPSDARAATPYAARFATSLILLLVSLMVVTTAALATTVAPAAAASAEGDYDPALTISVDSMNPSFVPSSGLLRVTGQITNVDEVDWVDINVYAFLGDAPMTTSQELVDASAIDPLVDVGDRIITPGTEDKIDLIEPGDSAPFSLAIPRSELEVTDAGVYWFGVHAIGSSETDPRDAAAVADGRARTFIPFVPEGTPGSIKTALVIPLRRYLDFTASGALASPEEWQKALAPGGRLRDAVDFGAAAGDRPVTWLVDPALPDAVRRLSNGNGGRSISPTIVESSEPPATPEGTPAPGEPSASPDAEGLDPEDELSPEIAITAEEAQAWLNRFGEALSGSEILTLPFGDLDVAAAAAHDPEVYDRSRTRPGAVLSSLGLPATPAVAAPAGYLSEAGFSLLDDETVLITDEAFEDAPGVAVVDGRRVAVTSSGVAAGGPGPDRPLSAVNLRQRLLAEAAVRLISPGRLPLVVQLPPQWRPAGGTSFFSGLDVDWVDLTTVEDATDRAGTALEASELIYPPVQDRRELDQDNFTASESLTRAGAVLQNLLTRNDRVGTAVAEQALTALSYGARRAPGQARTSAQASRAWIDTRLSAVEITAPPGVTLAGESGEFGAIVENRLDQPVSVTITAESADGQVIFDPIAPVQLAAGARTSVNLNAVSTDAGVHNVRLTLSDPEGNPLGGSDNLPIRSAQVSGVIWVIIGVGAVLLFGAIGLRLIRRIRGERAAVGASGA